MRKCMEEVQVLIGSMWPCVWINTIEEAAAVEDLREIVKTNFINYTLSIWSYSEGLKVIPTTKGQKQEPADPKYREIPALFANIREFLATQDQMAVGQIIVLRDLHNLMSDPRVRRAIRDIKEYKQDKYVCFVVISPSTDIHEEISKFFKVIHYDLPEEEEIRQLVNLNNKRAKVAKESGKNYEVLNSKELEPVVSACRGLTALEIEQLLFLSLKKNRKLDAEFMFDHKLEAIKKSGLLDFRKPRITLKDIGGHDLLKQWVKETFKLYEPTARQFGLPLPKGYMALGIPGNGKTALAEAIAGEWRVPFLSLNMSKVMSSRVGQSEQLIEAALKVVKEASPCVLLLDEADKSISGIQSSHASDSGVVARIFQSILNFLQENNQGVFVVMTCNDISKLPPELTRTGRLDAQWFFDLPDKTERKAIWNIHLGKYPVKISDKLINRAVDLSENYTGAEIEGAVNSVMRLAFVAGKEEITEEDIIAGIKEITPVYLSSKEKIAALRNWVKGRARFTHEIKEAISEEYDLLDSLRL